MDKSQQIYPTDLNDTQWSKIRLYLPAEAPTGRPREHGWRMILNGIFYILQEETLGLKLEIVEKLKDQSGFQILPKRWIVDRTFA